MRHAELMQTLEQLPQDKQIEVLDFAKFLMHRGQSDQVEADTLAESSLAHWIRHPLGIKDFQPLSREDANAR
ncbi:MAG: DUF2281 domain-containing protein [Halochromatium sp.]